MVYNMFTVLLLPQVFPETAASLVENIFVYVAEKNSAKLQGYALKYDGEVRYYLYNKI